MTPLENGQDLWLIQKARRGDKTAFGRLYDRHQARIFGLLRRLTGNRETAEDLTQETFLVAFASLNSWRGLGAFSSYLGGIAVRLYQAKRRREGRLSVVEVLPDSVPAFIAHDDPLSHCERHEAEDALETAIAALPESCREVFILVRIEGMRYQSAADLLEIPVGTVRSRMNRATSLLHTALMPLIYGEIPSQSLEICPDINSCQGEKHVVR